MRKREDIRDGGGGDEGTSRGTEKREERSREREKEIEVKRKRERKKAEGVRVNCTG